MEETTRTLRELIAWGETQSDEGIKERIKTLASNLRRLNENPGGMALKTQTLKNIEEFESYRALLRN